MTTFPARGLPLDWLVGGQKVRVRWSRRTLDNPSTGRSDLRWPSFSYQGTWAWVVSIVGDGGLYDTPRECGARVFASVMKTGLGWTFYARAKRVNIMSSLQSIHGRVLHGSP